MWKLFGNKQMDEEEFWKVISLLNWRYEGDDEKVIKNSVQYLAKKSDEDIFEFYELLSKFLYDLDGIEYAENIGEYSYSQGEYQFSVDFFLYARCVVVANGREFYYKVLNNSKEMPKDMEFESLLYIAPYAYEKKRKKEFNYLAKCSYETYSNKKKWSK